MIQQGGFHRLRRMNLHAHQTRNLLLIAAVIFVMGLVGGCAPRTDAGSLTVRDVWARPGIAGGNSAIYFIIDNRQGQADTLLSASSDAAGVVELHISKMDEEGNMTMEHQENVPIPSGEEVVFKPGGLHVMLMNLSDDLQPDEKITATLTFQNAGSVEVEATIREP